MKKLRLEILLTYDDMIMHGGDKDKDAKDWFFQNVLFDPYDSLVLHNHHIDDIGSVRVLSIHDDEEE